MSLFGYPATVTHYKANIDSWGRVSGYTTVAKNAKVVEEQKRSEEHTSELQSHS